MTKHNNRLKRYSEYQNRHTPTYPGFDVFVMKKCSPFISGDNGWTCSGQGDPNEYEGTIYLSTELGLFS